MLVLQPLFFGDFHSGFSNISDSDSDSVCFKSKGEPYLDIHHDIPVRL